MKNNSLLSVLDCRDELIRVMNGQHNILEYMKENSLIFDHDAKAPLAIDSAKLPDMQKVLQGEAHKLKNFDVVISVVGTMKAGKSTTINAIVGKEVLPNRNRPMTTLPTLICHEKGRDVPILKLDSTKIDELIHALNHALQEEPSILDFSEIKTLSGESSTDVIKKIQTCTKFKSEIVGSEAIFEELEYLNDLARILGIVESSGKIKADTAKNFYDSYKEVNALPIIFIEFESLKDISEGSEGRLMLLDTPGPNEANQPKLKEILEQQLKRSSAAILVLDYTQLKSEAEYNVREQIEKIPTIQKDRLYAVVNKFDQHTSNSDDRSKTISIVSTDLLKDKIEVHNVFPMSAKDAFFARRMLSHIVSTGEKPSAEEGWVQDFFGGQRDAEKRLRRDDLEDIQEDAEDALEDSYIEELIEKVINKAFVEAPKIAIDSAIANSQKIFEDLSNVFAIDGHFASEVKMSEEKLREIEETVRKLETIQQTLAKSSSDASVKVKELSDQVGIDIIEKLNGLNEQIDEIIKTFSTESCDDMEQQLQQVKDKLKIFSWEYLTTFRLTNKKLHQEEVILNTVTKQKDLVKVIRFSSPDKKQTYEKHIKEQCDILIEESNKAGNNILAIRVSALQEELEIFEKEYVKTVSEINREFLDSSIDLDITIPKMQDIIKVNLDSEIDFDQFDLSEEKKEITARDSIGGWLLRKIDFFDGEWGYDEGNYQEYDNETLIRNLQKIFAKQVINPIKDRSKKIMKTYGDGIISQYSTDIEQKTQALINQLKSAIDVEKAPEEELKVRKGHLNEAIRMNQSIVGAMSQVEIAKKALFPTKESE